LKSSFKTSYSNFLLEERVGKTSSRELTGGLLLFFVRLHKQLGDLSFLIFSKKVNHLTAFYFVASDMVIKFIIIPLVARQQIRLGLTQTGKWRKDDEDRALWTASVWKILLERRTQAVN
jgi:hypothetical protein